MDLEKLKEFLKTDDGKAFISEYTEDEVKGLKAKNEKLLATNKKLKEEKEEVETKLSEIDLERDDADNDKIKKSGDLEALEKRLVARFEKEKKDLLDKNSVYNEIINKKTVEDGLTNALIANNVAKQHIPAVKALLKSSAKIETVIEDGDSVARIDGKDLNEYVKDWALGDTGKIYIAADLNNGGGAQGSNGGSKGTVDVSKLSAKEKMNLGRAKANQS